MLKNRASNRPNQVISPQLLSVLWVRCSCGILVHKNDILASGYCRTCSRMNFSATDASVIQSIREEVGVQRKLIH